MLIVRHDGDRAVVLALSDERDRYERRIDAAWRDGYAAAMAEVDALRMRAFSDGWDRCGEAERERRWVA